MKSKSKSKSDSNNSSPLKINSLSNTMKEKKMLVDKILDKLNENKLYTVAIAIFLELKANNYEITSTKIINQKIISDYKTNKKQYLKNEKESEYYESEGQVVKAIVAVLTATNVFRKIKKGNQNFVKFNFLEAEEYLKKIKNRQISSLIKNEFENYYKNLNNIKNNNNSNSNNNSEVNENKNINKEKEKENNQNLSSMDMQDDNFGDDFSISIDSNFVGGEEKKLLGNKRENSFDEEEKNLMTNNDMNNNQNSNSLNNIGINLNNGIKKRKYNKQKKGLIGQNKKNLKIIKSQNNYESDSEEVKMLENYDIIHDNNSNNNSMQKRIIKHRRHRKRKNLNNKMIKNENDTQKVRGRPKKKFNMMDGNLFFKDQFNNQIGNGLKKNYPFISITNNKLNLGQNNLNIIVPNNKGGNNDKVIEIIEESSEEVKSRQINNYLEHLYSFSKLGNQNNNKNNQNSNNISNIDANKSNNQENNMQNNNEESIKNISEKSLNIISKIKVLYEQMDKMEDNLELLNNLFNQTTSSSTYNDSEASPHKNDKSDSNNNNNKTTVNNVFLQNLNINDSKVEKLYKDMKKNESFLDLCYNNMELTLTTLNNINKITNWNKNDQLIITNKRMLKEYEKKYNETLEVFSRNLNEINELAFNNNALKIYENIKQIKEKLKKEKIAIGSLDDFFKKLENNFENESNKFFNVENIKQIYIDKKNRLLNNTSKK